MHIWRKFLLSTIQKQRGSAQEVTKDLIIYSIFATVYHYKVRSYFTNLKLKLNKNLIRAKPKIWMRRFLHTVLKICKYIISAKFQSELCHVFAHGLLQYFYQWNILWMTPPVIEYLFCVSVTKYFNLAWVWFSILSYALFT